MITTSYIGHSTDPDIRYRATSGGIGSSIIKYLFDSGSIGTSISFTFDKDTLLYSPRIIYGYTDYNICGSIYQEMDLIGFIRDNIEYVRGTFACFCLPCQTRAIRSMLKRAGHECIIIGLTCSSSQDIEATKYLFKRERISMSDVRNLQYRGNGWPSGIQVLTKSNGGGGTLSQMAARYGQPSSIQGYLFKNVVFTAKIHLMNTPISL